jgi:PST family polysaccharide transporter
MPLAGASLLVLAMLNVDSAVIGAVLGPTALGLYQIAFNISSWPVRAVSETARRVSFAGFSRVAHSTDALAHAFGRGLRLLMTAAVPACVLLGTLAEPLVRTVYGNQWTAAAGPLRFLAALGLLRVAFELAYDCLSAAGRRRALLLVQGSWLVALIPVLWFLAGRLGINGVGLGHVLVAGLLAGPLFVLAVRRAGVPVRTILRSVGPAFLGGTVCGLLSWSLQRLLGDGAVSLVVAGAAGLVGYAVVLLPWVRTWRGHRAVGAHRASGRRVPRQLAEEAVNRA